jgi:flavin reductase (DIM6/NTAB) family NADH-FMN oxidoreductase RutF
MTISWLTPIDNQGHFICSINQKRYTCLNLRNNPLFVLNVPTLGQEELICSIGSCSGHNFTTSSKLDHLQIKPFIYQDDDAIIGIYDTVCRMICTVIERSERNRHDILTCKILSAEARQDYWNGKQFVSQSSPILSFLGTKRFATITSI